MFKENDYTNMHKKINNIEVDSEPLNPGGHETLILDQNEVIDIKIAPGEGTLKNLVASFFCDFLNLAYLSNLYLIDKSSWF